MFAKMMKMCIPSVLSEIGIFLVSVVLCLVLIIVTSFSSGNSEDVFIVLLFFYIILLIMGIIAVISLFLLHLLSVILANKKLTNIPGFSKERLQRELARMPKFKKIYACSDAIVYLDQYSMVQTIALDDIIWAYKTYAVKYDEIELGLVTGKMVKILVKESPSVINKGAAINYLLRLIARKNKGILIGYDESLEVSFKKDFDSFLQEANKIEVVESEVLEQEYIKNNYYEKDFCA